MSELPGKEQLCWALASGGLGCCSVHLEVFLPLQLAILIADDGGVPYLLGLLHEGLSQTICFRIICTLRGLVAYAFLSEVSLEDVVWFSFEGGAIVRDKELWIPITGKDAVKGCYVVLP